jgi:hypothetical protein
MSATLNPRIALKILTIAISTLMLLHGAMVVAEYGFGRPGFLELRALFDMNREQNIPTLFSTLQLLACAALSLLVGFGARTKREKGAFYWFGLGAFFAFLGGDEFCEWHEHLVGPLRESLHLTGALSFGWVIPYSALVLVFAGAYARFWWRLPRKTRALFPLAGMLYVGSGIGMEMLGSKLFTVYGWESVQFDAETMVEEGGEMFGVALFLFAILDHLAQRLGSAPIVLQLGGAAPAVDPLMEDTQLAERFTEEETGKQQRQVAA